MEVGYEEVSVMRMYMLLKDQLERAGYDLGSELLNFLMDRQERHFILSGYFGRGFKLVKELVDEDIESGVSYHRLRYEIYSENETSQSFVWILNRNMELRNYKIKNKN